MGNMNPSVESAWIAASAAVVGILGTATVGIVGFVVSRATNRETIAAAKATTEETLNTAHQTNQATIDATHADIRRTLEATRDGQIADRYSKAIDQLGSDQLDMRIGGVYALEGVANDSPRYHQAVVDVLSAFVRVRSRQRQEVTDTATDKQGQQLNLPDVQAAVTVIGRRDAALDKYVIDLSYANLQVAKLAGAKLHGADLTGTYFWSADLSGADLSGARLNTADFTNSRLRDANLSGAGVWGAHFDDADLTGANMTDVVLDSVNIRRADLTHATVDGVRFAGGSNLLGARIPETIPLPAGWVRDEETNRISLATEPGQETE
jgi:uncharacterized protein YjbI with pentapeptide repeats